MSVAYGIVRAGPVSNRPYMATRPDLNSPFGPLSDAYFVNQWGHGCPVISGDGLTLFYAGWDLGILMATRPDPTSVFGPGSPIANAVPHARPSWISRDGLRLYFHGVPEGGFDLYLAERASVGEDFGVPSAAPSVSRWPDSYFAYDRIVPRTDLTGPTIAGRGWRVRGRPRR